MVRDCISYSIGSYYIIFYTVDPKITKLAVSAGENKVLKYPINSGSLTAFAIPAPDDGRIKFVINMTDK